MKKIITLLFALLLLCNIGYSSVGPITTVGSPAICFGTAISIPVTVTQFTDVGAMSLTLNYDPSDLVYQEVSVNTVFSGVDTNGSIPGVFTLAWVDLTQTGISLDPNEILFTLTFTLATGFTQGSTDFTWVENPSSANLYRDPEGIEYDKSPFGSFFIGGMLTVHPLPVPTISGQATLCQGSTFNKYTTEANMTNYQWTVIGGTIIAGGNTTSDTVIITWCSSGTGHVKVNYTDNNGCTAAAQTDYAVTIDPPVPPIAGWAGDDPLNQAVNNTGCEAVVNWLGTEQPDRAGGSNDWHAYAWEMWQSYTVGTGKSGLLTKIRVNFYSANNIIMKVFAGTGNTCTLLYSQNYTVVAGWNDFILPQNVAPYVFEGQIYTIDLGINGPWGGNNPVVDVWACNVCTPSSPNEQYWDNTPAYPGPVLLTYYPGFALDIQSYTTPLPLTIAETCGVITSVLTDHPSGSTFPPGTTEVKYTVTNNGNQNVESFFDVFVETDLTGSAGNDGPVCEGTALTLTADGGGGGGGYTYDWTGPDDSTYTGSPLVIPVATVAQHNGLWKVDITDIYDCTVRETTTVTVTALQVAAYFTADSLFPLKYSTVQLTDLSTGGATGWEWSFDGDSVEYVNGTTEHFQNPQVQFTDGGLYTVTLMVSNGCSMDTAVKTGYIRVGRPGWWTGETSKNWHYSKNWDNHLVPDGGTDVIIPTIEPGCFNPKVPHNLVTNVDCSNLIFVGEAVLEIEGDLIVNPGTEVIVKDSATVILITP